MPSDLRDREGIPTRKLLEDTLNRQAEQAQAVTVAESTLRRDALLEPPRDDRPVARMPDMYDGDPKKWHEFKTSFTAYMMSQSLQYKHILDHDDKRYGYPNRTGPVADASAQDTHEDFSRYWSNYEVRNHKVFNSLKGLIKHNATGSDRRFTDAYGNTGHGRNLWIELCAYFRRGAKR